MRRPTKNNFMKTWLKSIGSAKTPITEAPFHGDYRAEQIGFRKEGKPSVRSGDRLFLYAPGGSRHIFALTEAVGDPEHDPNYNPNEEGSCRWKLTVRYIPNLNLSVASGVHIDDVISHRKVKLTKSIGQKSHIELHLEESESAYHLLHEKAKLSPLREFERAPSDITAPPDRIEARVLRIIRDTVAAKSLKAIYDYNCQVCGLRIEPAPGKYGSSRKLGSGASHMVGSRE